MDDTKQVAVFRAMEEKRLVDGVLADVPEAGAGGSAWHMVTEVRSDLLDVLRAGHSCAQVMCEVFGREGDNSFWVLGYQAAFVQHRFLLPLVGPSVGCMIDQVAHTGIRLLMHSDLKALILEAVVPVPPDIHSSLREHHGPITDANSIFKEHAKAIAKLLDPGFLTPIEGLPAPRTVSVSSVLPIELARLTQKWEDEFCHARDGEHSG